MKKIYLLFTVLTAVTAQSQIINFPDAAFKAKLLASRDTNTTAKNASGNYIKIDSNNNNEIEISEALNVYGLDVADSQISDLTGINHFINLQNINCRNNQIAFLDFTGIEGLIEINCEHNQLNTLIPSGRLTLNKLYCSYNLLTSLQLPNYTSLLDLSVERNLLSELNITGCNLMFLFGIGNSIASIDLSTSTSLWRLWLDGNKLSNIDVSNCPHLEEFLVAGNLMPTIDISNNPRISMFHVADNPVLESIFMKNGGRNTPSLANNPNLKYICADEDEIEDIQSWLVHNQTLETIQINSYCSFVPGGVFYTIAGSAKFDSDNNGCGAADINLPNLKYSITNGTVSGNIVANNAGEYSIGVQAGNHTLRPIFENPTYFTAAAATVNFPAAASPSTQNFCITATGTHPDLEVFINPNIAIPGFDSLYNIVYKNKGNVTQSGTVTFGFDDAVSDFVSANLPVASQATNQLTWHFTDLKPFETREIAVVLNLNAPTATPPLNADDLLHFTASIDAGADDTPEDNIFAIDQMVFNSFDPNDKTCLEGAIIGPQHIGKYVHYKIRFENTGTFAAKNIVVKDMIDVSKFDISSLVPLSGSHIYTTKIDNTGKAEFIFENINLPFDDANNDGYVIFKIKTKSNLAVGNSFSNQASIYFDYNFPIVTNNATTTIAALAANDFDFAAYFTLYPNPADDLLKIQHQKNIKISSLTIYDIAGRLVQSVSNPEISGIDVSSLKTGNYFIKINSDKGTTNAKFAKK